MTQIETLSQLKKVLLSDGAVTRPPAEMPPQIRRLCPGAEEIAVVKDYGRLLGTVNGMDIYELDDEATRLIAHEKFTPLEKVSIHDLPAIVIWR